MSTSIKPKTLEEHKASIQKAIDQDGQFTHNIISCVLRSVAAEHGEAVADGLIEEFDIEALYSISPRGGK